VVNNLRRAVLSVALAAGVTGSVASTGPSATAAATTTAAAATSAATKAFCAKVKTYNTTIIATFKKNPGDRSGLAAARVKGWATLAKAAPPDVAKGLQNMAAAVKQSVPPAPADMAVAIGYVERNCKVTLA
jgi:hypothetical protein